jgi:hypothetical protein
VKDKKFEVRLHLEVKEVKEGGTEEFFENNLLYHDIGYDGVVAIESALLETLGQLNDWGVMTAMEAGLGERLSALGLDSKVAALSVGKAG